MWLIGKTLSWLDQRQGRFGFTGDRNARLSARRPSPRRIAQRRPTAARTPLTQSGCSIATIRHSDELTHARDIEPGGVMSVGVPTGLCVAQILLDDGN